MILIAFDNDWDTLHHYLDVLNNDTNSMLLADVQKEFIFLQRTLACCAYEAPEVEKVADQLISAGLSIDHGIVDGKDDIFIEKLITEITFKVISKIISSEKKNKFYKIPDDLRTAVSDFVKDGVFQSKEIATLHAKFLKTLGSDNRSHVSELAKKFRLTKVTPEEVYYGSKRTKMTKELKLVWEYFSARYAIVDKIIEWCSVGYVEAEQVFHIPFFDLIKWKPSSLRYRVLDLFSTVEERQTADMVLDCKAVCAAEIQRYNDCLNKYVIEEGVVQQDEEIISTDDLISILVEYSQDCSIFFAHRFKSSIRISDYQEKDVRMLCDIFERINSIQSISAIFGVNMEDSDLCREAVNIGICGLNTHSLDLFKEAIIGISLTNRGKINKSRDELSEIKEIVRDVQALLNTLMPVGEVI